MEHSLFEIVTTTAGATSIRNKKVNEIMHNPVGPWKEANELYIEQSNLKESLRRETSSELVIFDIGLGAAANALAVLHAAKSTLRPLRLVSFEIDLDLLNFALAHSQHFAHFRGYENIIQQLLENKYWETKNIIWELHHGDFLKCIDSVKYPAHLIYYDPYSPKVNQEMWTTECFKKLRKKCQPEALFYNYSQATPIRAALLAAGFFVGYGKATGLKKSTTQAACRLEDLESPLDHRWLERWKKSHAQLPYHCKNPEKLKTEILSHKQFELFLAQ